MQCPALNDIRVDRATGNGPRFGSGPPGCATGPTGNRSMYLAGVMATPGNDLERSWVVDEQPDCLLARCAQPAAWRRSAQGVPSNVQRESPVQEKLRATAMDETNQGRVHARSALRPGSARRPASGTTARWRAQAGPPDPAPLSLPPTALTQH